MKQEPPTLPADLKWRLSLAALAYLASALAGLLALYANNRALGIPAASVVAWFGLCFAVVWGRGGEPNVHPLMRRGADVTALVVVALLALRLRQVVGTQGLGGDEWRAIVALGMLALLMVNGLIIVAPDDAERSLLGALVLSLYSALQLETGTGTILLALFMWLWLGAMVLAVMIEDGNRRAMTGDRLLGEATAARMLRSGFGLSLLVVALGIGSLLAAQGSPRLSKEGQNSAASPDAWRYGLEMNFRSQVGLRPGKRTICRVRGPKNICRFRIQAYDTYTSDGWLLKKGLASEIAGGNQVEVIDSFGLGASTTLPGRDFEVAITTQIHNIQVVFTAERPIILEGDFPGPLLSDSTGSLRCMYPLPGGFDYRLRGWSPDWARLDLHGARHPVPELLGPEYWALPPGLPARLRDKAHELSAAEESPWGKALAIAGALKKSHRYRTEFLVPPQKKRTDPVDYFIFESTSGNCLNFASALAVMCRLNGIPARLVVGYLPHRYDETKSEWIITPADGHAWCEIALEVFGWVPIDPVPPARIGDIPVGGPPDPHPTAMPMTHVSAEVERAVSPGISFAGLFRVLVRQAEAGWPWLLVAGALFWTARTVWRVRRTYRIGTGAKKPKARNEVERAYFGLCDAAANLGYSKRAAQTPLEYARNVGVRLPTLRADLLALAELYTRAEYHEAGPDAGMEKEARELALKLKAGFPR